MPQTLNITIDAEAALARLGEAAQQRIVNAMVAGLREGGDYAASAVVGAAVQKGMQSRSGSLLNSVISWPDGRDEFAIFVGVPEESPARKYAYLLTNETKSIAPVKGEYLAIPVGANLSGAGVAKYDSPRQIGNGEFVSGQDVYVNWGGGFTFTGLSFGVVDGDIYSPYFILLRGVHVQGFDVLDPTMQQQAGEIRALIEERIAAVVKGGQA